jgi:hypothetical protein
MQISEHFHLEEFTASETAERKGINNEPPPAVIEKLKVTARGNEHVRLILGVPILVLSGYRSLEVNAVIGGAMTKDALEQVMVETMIEEVRQVCRNRLAHGEFSKDISQHCYGEADDFHAPRYGSPLAICRAIDGSDVRFDQLILEGGWVHVSFVDDRKPRGEVLTWKRGAGYTPGLPLDKAA